ncbi:hypothetical protein LPB138_08525 [Urechidicola croceus]|uniref:Neurotransmitter-gated ion-channel ligand-binding domain-containing protein n=2 Tax=Urechidicola croceus TaxID=1850246 RepID=A0A1D8P828_9FLAO|nr:hypothetical protein LPB138_08525 [Urechidicola croceus]
MWFKMHRHKTNDKNQLTDITSVNKYLKDSVEQSVLNGALKIKTGIYLQSLNFSNANDVQLTGYIWQHYKDSIHDEFKPDHTQIGFILPDQVNSAGDIEPREVYRKRNDNEEVIGWYFEATLRQPFDYSKYPFDRNSVWVRMWPSDFINHVILVPDLEAYNSTDLNVMFGIEKKIVLGIWEPENTFFNYKTQSYDTSFGINDNSRKSIPELHYNFVVKRKLESAFITYLLPLFLVAALLFAALLTVSKNDRILEKMGFNNSTFIGTSSALFFVVMLAHIQLKQQFQGAGIVYVEYFYILMYGMLVICTTNTYLFSISSKKNKNIITWKDNLLPKISYWPFLLGSIIIITFFFY